MKKYNFLSFLLIFAFIFISVDNYAQQVSKNYVVVEIGTGTWCFFCPGASLGADDLVENGHQVAIIENHDNSSGSDIHAYAGSNARNSYYGISSFPYASFNGLDPVPGGSHTSSLYNDYLPKYNTAIAVMSDFTLDMSYTHTGLDYAVTLNIDEVGNYTSSNLVVHLVLTESHVQENWQGQTELNFISRAMYPSFNGTAYSGGNSSLNINFTTNATWNLSNSELVAFIQDYDTREILQVAKVALTAEPEGTNNIILAEVNGIDDVICFGSVSPSIKVKNYGSADVTSMTIDYSINSGASTGTYNWTGAPIAFNNVAQISMDEISGFDLQATNTMDFEISSINGVADDYPSNNMLSINFDKSPEAVNQIIKLELHVDGFGHECTWNIKDGGGAIIESGGPYEGNQTINETFIMPGQDCYSFSIIDSYGDGGGEVYLRDADDNQLFYTNGQYNYGETQIFKTPAVVGIDKNTFSTISIFPNPANSILNIKNANGLTVSIIDIFGRELFVQEIATTKQQINIGNFAEGTYIVKLTDGVKVRTEKVVIYK